MKNTSLLSTKKNSSQRMTMSLGFALTLVLLRVNADPIDVNLGTANNFAVLAGSTITSTGASVINGGNVGLSPGTAITGFPPATITPPFTTFVAEAVALQAQNDLFAAYNAAAGFAPNQTLTGQDLGGLTLTPGVYFFASSAQLTGVLTLNNEGNPDAVFIFQIGSTLTTASDSSVVTINAGSAAGVTPGISVFWQIGSSATLGTGTDFEGNILANTSITADTGATIDGRLLAKNGAVTLDDNTITAPPAEVIGGTPVPDPGSTLLLLGSSCAVLCSFRRRLFS
jgi:Ice-binding-like